MSLDSLSCVINQYSTTTTKDGEITDGALADAVVPLHCRAGVCRCNSAESMMNGKPAHNALVN